MTVLAWTARLGVLGAVALGLSGCGYFDDEEPLQGERIPVRSADERSAAPQTEGAVAPLPQPQALTDWTQTNGGPSHNGGNIAGGTGLNRAWSVDAGSGGSGSRITSAPIVTGGRVFVLDAETVLRSLDASSGARGWQVSLAPANERGSEGYGGGLAALGGTIFATTGFGEVIAVRAADGTELWRQRFGAPFRAAPAAADGIVVAVGRDNQAYGLDPTSGQVVWRLQGATADTGLLGGASPAISGTVALVPFGSGELVAVAWQPGQRLWTALLSGGRRGLARSSISDVTGDPVVVGPLVVAANQSGRTVAIEGATGRRVWTRTIGSTGPIWAAGEALFVMGDDATLARLSARNGATVWSRQLPAFTDPGDREGAIGYSGPVLVGGRVLVTDSGGTLRAFDGVTGTDVGTADIGDGSVTGPVAAGGLVYVLDEDGTLHAFR